MLTITARAMTVIRRVSEHPSLEATAGVRVSARPEADAPTEVRAVHHPEPGDRVVDRSGARLYLDRETEHLSDGRELDAVTRADGTVQFVLRSAA
ncbi:hypothetical protein [Nocardioides mangrovi]|uniref:Fe-S cluster assembly protein HesB n=1 Tax=Nocardioides mangrovi TaxID=2874580 RepID=A0ABS7UJ06_9ACTN|nr:hypothetical protein [Nocardioides mangrovi]MBZ5740646.1 hypothetical protein [Nocardioides mangrovi]